MITYYETKRIICTPYKVLIALRLKNRLGLVWAILASQFIIVILFQVIEELRDKNGDVTQATAALFAKSLKLKW